VSVLDKFLDEAFPPKKAGAGKPPSGAKPPFLSGGGAKPGATKPNPFAGGGKKPFPPTGGAASSGGPQDEDAGDENPFSGEDDGQDPFGQQQGGGMDPETFQMQQQMEQERERQEAEARAAQEKQEQAEREKIKQMRAQADAEVADDLDTKFNEVDDQVVFYPHIDQIHANSDGETFADHMDKKMKGEEDDDMYPGDGEHDGGDTDDKENEVDAENQGEDEHGRQSADDMPDGTDVDKSDNDKDELDTDKLDRFSRDPDNEPGKEPAETKGPQRRTKNDNDDEAGNVDDEAEAEGDDTEHDADAAGIADERGDKKFGDEESEEPGDEVECPECDGKGDIDGEECTNCDGQGVIHNDGDEEEGGEGVLTMPNPFDGIVPPDKGKKTGIGIGHGLQSPIDGEADDDELGSDADKVSGAKPGDDEDAEDESSPELDGADDESESDGGDDVSDDEVNPKQKKRLRDVFDMEKE